MAQLLDAHLAGSKLGISQIVVFRKLILEPLTRAEVDARKESLGRCSVVDIRLRKQENEGRCGRYFKHRRELVGLIG